MQLWRWISHWKFVSHWKNTAITLKNAYKGNHITLRIITLKYFPLLFKDTVITLKIFKSYWKISSVTHTVCSQDFQRYSRFSVWFSVISLCQKAHIITEKWLNATASSGLYTASPVHCWMLSVIRKHCQRKYKKRNFKLNVFFFFFFTTDFRFLRGEMCGNCYTQ